MEFWENGFPNPDTQPWEILTLTLSIFRQCLGIKNCHKNGLTYLYSSAIFIFILLEILLEIRKK